MHRMSTLSSRISLELPRSRIGSALTTRTWIQQRQGLNGLRRQFHATPRINLAWSTILVAGALPQLIRMYLDVRQTEKYQRQLEKIGPLMDICSTITSKRRKRLSMTAVSMKLDEDKLKYLNKIEREFKDRLFHKNFDSQAWNHNVFIPSVLHVALTSAIVPYLNSKATILEYSQDPEMLLAYSLFSENAYYAHSIAGFILMCGYLSYVNGTPFWKNFTSRNVTRMAPLWRFLYVFNYYRFDTGSTVIPWWLYYLRFNKDKWDLATSSKRSPGEMMGGSTASPERKEATGYTIVNLFCTGAVGLGVFALGPLAMLYLLGALGGYGIRSAIGNRYSAGMAIEYQRQQAKWMPLGPVYDVKARAKSPVI